MSENTTWPEELSPTEYTPEQWILKYFTNFELLSLNQFERNILSAETVVGEKMTLFNTWLYDTITGDPGNGFIDPPCTYAELKEEAIEILNSLE